MWNHFMGSVCERYGFSNIAFDIPKSFLLGLGLGSLERCILSWHVHLVLWYTVSPDCGLVSVKVLCTSIPKIQYTISPKYWKPILSLSPQLFTPVEWPPRWVVDYSPVQPDMGDHIIVVKNRGKFHRVWVLPVLCTCTCTDLITTSRLRRPFQPTHANHHALADGAGRAPSADAWQLARVGWNGWQKTLAWAAMQGQCTPLSLSCR